MTTCLRANCVIAAFTALCAPSAFGATPWETYVAVPSPEHAKLVVVASYSSAEAQVSNGGLGRLEQDLLVLGQQIRAGDAEAFYLGLRLRSSPAVDGAVSEYLDFTLADFLRIRPVEFLGGLNIYGTEKCVEAVYADPDIFADRFAAQIYEDKRRLEAIAAVRNARLAHMRDLCIQALRADISSAESRIDSH